MAQNLVGRQINTELARAFRQIVTAGWANKSDGNVEAPIGHFALVTIEPAELEELVNAVFGDEPDIDPPTIYPGAYLVCEDSDGNTELLEYYVESGAEAAFNQMAREFAIWDATCPNCGNAGPHERLPGGNVHQCACGTKWDPTKGAGQDPEKLYLVCEVCGEAFDEIKIAFSHIEGFHLSIADTTDPSDISFSIKPESEAM